MIHRYEAHRGPVYHLAYSDPEYAFLASCSDVVSMWQGTLGLHVRSFQKETRANIRSISYWPGGTHLASGAEDGTVLLWGLVPNQKGVVRAKVASRYGGHPGGVEHVAISPDAKYLAGGGPEALTLWEIAGEEKLHQWKLFIRSPIVFSPDGKKIIAGVDDQTTTIWDIESKKELMKLPKGRSDADALAISSDGKMLATGGWEGAIHFWEVESGKEVVPWQKK